MRILLFIFLTFLSIQGFCQWPINAYFGTNKSRTEIRGVGVTDSAFQFRYCYPDTATANAGTVDLLPGAYIRLCDGTFYSRNETANAWVRVGGGGGSITGGINGLSASGANILLGGSALSQYTDITTGSFPMTLINNGVNNAAQTDSNGVRFVNNTASTSVSDSLVTPALIFSANGRKSTPPPAGSQNVTFRVDELTTGTTSSLFRIRASVNGAAFSHVFSINAAGIIPDNLNLNTNPIGTANNITSNLRFGGSALASSSLSGTANIAIGTGTLNANTTGTENIGLGAGALNANLIGEENTAIGVSALFANDTNYNTAVGAYAMMTNTKGQSNAAFGKNALLFNTTGQKNTGIGTASAENTTTGSFNTAVGMDALLDNTTGSLNTAVGWTAGDGNATGSGNVYIGPNSASSLLNGDNNTFIGYRSGTNASQNDTVSNTVVIGVEAYSTASNQIVLGNSSMTTAYLYGVSDGSDADSIVTISNNQIRKVAASVLDIPISSLLAATATNSINNAGFAQTWSWNSLTSGAGLTLNATASSTSESRLFEVLRSSNTSSGRHINIYSVNSNQTFSGQTPSHYAGFFSSRGTTVGGATKTNYGIYTNARSGDVNYAIYSDTGLVHLNDMTANSILGVNSTKDVVSVALSGLSFDGTTLSVTGGSTTWNGITNPTGDQALTFDAGESSTWTNSNTTEDLFTVNSSTMTTSSLFSLNSTSTALASGNNLMELIMSGANATNGITATPLVISVTNTNATSGTNIGIDVTASGATTANWAVSATGAMRTSVGLFPTTDDGAVLGSTALKWSDLFLASGAVINFNAGNYTLTHTAGNLTANGNMILSSGNFIASTGSVAANLQLLSNSTGSNANFAVMSSTGGASATGAALLFGGAASVGIRTVLNGNAGYAMSANQNYSPFIVGRMGATEAASGVHAALAMSAVFTQSTVTGGSATTTDATSVYIEGRPLGANGFVTTNPTSALWVDAGLVRIDDTLSVNVVSPSDRFAINGNISLTTAGNKLKIATGSNASIGVSAAMTAGTITISTTAVTTNSRIFLTHATLGGTQGILSVGTITDGTSFVINSSSATDTGTVNWLIIN